MPSAPEARTERPRGRPPPSRPPAPWYVRNWIRTGSPLFPFYLEIWPAQAPGWDLERSRLYETLFSLYGDVRGPLDYLWSPIRLAVAAQPDQPAFYDGVLG